MMRSHRQYFSGETLEQAVMSAARHYGIDPDRMLYQRIEKRHGFLKVRRRVVIQVDPDKLLRSVSNPIANAEPASAHPPRPERPRSGGRPARSGNRSRSEHRGEPDDRPQPSTLTFTPLAERFPEATGEAAEAADQALAALCKFADLHLTGVVLQGEDQLEIDLSGEDDQRLTDDEGRLLLAIQHLLPRLIYGRLGTRVLCRVDCHHFHERREAGLQDLAQRVASEVRRQERPKTLRSMSPWDRRVVHVALADDPRVETESNGEGYYKRITVRPV